MAWPAPNSYREAIQCPQICFRDPDLKAGLVVVDKQGLPAVSSGNYASVYSLSLPSGRIAIRCFNHRVPDQEQRYDEISRQLRLSSLPYTVDFRFVSEGIMVDGDWYPILRMEWVSGDPLLNYIETNLSQPEKLMALAQQWMQMARRLQRSCIAHGDLQHGNIIISNDAIKLIDYDGMYVPALDGLKSNERGHRNYQHPDRGAGFGPQLDNFSSWVIYGSLLILGIDPSLWHQLGKHDEFLLFKESDFEHPDSSTILDLLRGHPCQQLRDIGAELRNVFGSVSELVPDLDHSAPLPVDEVQDFQTIFHILGLSSNASMNDIQQSAEIFAKVWDSRHFRTDSRLMRRAEKKLAELNTGVAQLLAKTD